MNKPAGYDNAAAFTGEFERLELGGHILVIRGAKTIFVNGNEYLSIAFDCARGDKQEGFFQRQFNSRKSDPNAQWPAQGTIRYGTSEQGVPFLKGFVKAVEESNPGYTWNWDEKTLTGKFFGGVFAEEEYKDRNTGAIRTATRCRFARSVETIRNGVPVPEKRTLKESAPVSVASVPATATEVDDEQLPF